MAEGVLQFLDRIKNRRSRRSAGWQQNWQAGPEGGPTPGMRGQINPLDSQAISDRAQGIDITEVNPPRGIRADRIEAPEESAPESPFRFAAGSGGEGARVIQTGNKKVCINGQCFPSAEAAQAAMGGEYEVPGSSRVISTRVLGGPSPQGEVTASSAPAAVLSPMAQRIQQIKELGGLPTENLGQWATSMALADEEAAARGGLDIYDRANLARSAAAWRESIPEFMALENTQKMWSEKWKAAQAIQKQQEEAFQWQMQKDRMTTPEGRVEMEERILNNHSLAPEVRAQILQDMNIRSRTEAGVQYDDNQLKAEQDMLAGRAVGKTVAYSVVNTGIVSGWLKPTNERQQRDAAANHDNGAVAWQSIVRRYGNMPANTLLTTMHRDMLPPLRDSILASRTGGVLEITREMESSAENEASAIIDAYHSKVLDWQGSNKKSWLNWGGQPSMAPTSMPRRAAPQSSAPATDAAPAPAPAQTPTMMNSSYKF